VARYKNDDTIEAANARAIADMIAEPSTPEATRIKLINTLLELKKNDNFFQTMMEEKLSFGSCPYCDHENHWLVPEEELNQMGYVTHEIDMRVPRMTTRTDCEVWQEACKKKKVTI
jgi:hypothetical protein